MNYVTSKDIVIPAGTALVYPAPEAKAPVTYAHGKLTHKLMDEHEPDQAYHFSIPLDEALKVGLIEEVE